MVIFKTLKIEGFGCYSGFRRFVLNEPGINIIVGDNGEGKTTLFNALYWVCYGKSLKGQSEVPTWEHLRGEDWEGTMVSLTFIKDNIKYKVIRCKDYKNLVEGVKGKDRLFIIKQGVEIPIRDKRVLQKKLESILGFGADLFINAIMFPQKGKRFIEEPGPKKKEILEKAFDLTWISEVAEDLKNKRKELDTEIRLLQGTVNNNEALFDSYEEMLDSIRGQKNNFEKGKAFALSLLRKDRDAKEEEQEAVNWDPDLYETRVSRVTILKREIAAEKLKPHVKEANQARVKLGSNSTAIKNTQENINSNQLLIKESADTDDCPVCGQVMDPKRHKEHVDGLEKDLKTEEARLVKLVDTKAELLKAIEKAEASEKRIKAWGLELSPLEDSVKVDEKNHIRYNNLTETLSGLAKQIKNKKAEEFTDTSASIKEKLNAVKVLLRKEKVNLTAKNSQWQLHDWALRGAFGSNGLNTYLFNILLQKLNTRLEYYSQYTGFIIELVIHSSGTRDNIEAIITRDGFPVQYDDLSAGEQQITNLVLGFAQADILVSENPTNLWAGDEILESLDKKNVEKVANFLQTFFTPERSIFIITHKDHFRPTGSNIININKNDEL